MSDRKIRTLIVDDSAITRGIFEKAFRATQDFQVVNSVSNGRKAVDFCRENQIDLVVSDYDMPEMDGIETLRILWGEMGIPVCIYAETSDVKNKALSAGALYFAIKPSFSSFSSKTMDTFISELYAALKDKIRRTEKNGNKKEENNSHSKEISYNILCIGASTGGPTAVEAVLKNLGNNFPIPILYVQHIDSGSDAKMVSWFNTCCPNLPMHLARNGEVALKGNVYMAPADKHLVIDYLTEEGNPVLKLSDEPPERFLKPAVNKLFRSAASLYREQCLAVLMTGMGRDGAEGCKEIVNNGGYTIAEDKSTCAVFGMPAAAIELDAASLVLPRNKIAETILSLV